MVYIAVYGTLLQGFYNYQIYLKNHKPIQVGTIWIKGKLFDLGDYPGLYLNDECDMKQLLVQVYDINEQQAQKVDNLEGYPDLYNRIQILVGKYKSWIYIINMQNLSGQQVQIRQVNWRQYKSK